MTQALQPGATVITERGRSSWCRGSAPSSRMACHSLPRNHRYEMDCRLFQAGLAPGWHTESLRSAPVWARVWCRSGRGRFRHDRRGHGAGRSLRHGAARRIDGRLSPRPGITGRVPNGRRIASRGPIDTNLPWNHRLERRALRQVLGPTRTRLFRHLRRPVFVTRGVGAAMTVTRRRIGQENIPIRRRIGCAGNQTATGKGGQKQGHKAGWQLEHESNKAV